MKKVINDTIKKNEKFSGETTCPSISSIQPLRRLIQFRPDARPEQDAAKNCSLVDLYDGNIRRRIGNKLSVLFRPTFSLQLATFNA